MSAKTILFLLCIGIGLFNIFGVPILFAKLGDRGTNEKLPWGVYAAVIGCGILVMAVGLFFYIRTPQGFKS